MMAILGNRIDPIVVSVMTFVIGMLFVHETRHVKIHEEHMTAGVTVPV